MIGENTKVKTRNGAILAKNLEVGMEIATIDGFARIESISKEVSNGFLVILFRNGYIFKLETDGLGEFAIDSNVSGVEGRDSTKEDIERCFAINLQPFADIYEIISRERSLEGEHPVTKLTCAAQAQEDNPSAPFVVRVKDARAVNFVRIKTEENKPFLVLDNIGVITR